MSMADTLRELRQGYGATMTCDECVALCNAAAWMHRADGWGVSRKEAGTYGVRHDGQRCCVDVLMFPDGRYWDVLGAAPDLDHPHMPATVAYRNGDPAKTITDPSRGWVAPIAPQGTGTGTMPPPVVTPQPPAAGITEDQVRAIVRAELLRAESELAWLRGCLQETTRALGEMRALLEQQDRRREELAIHADEVLVERTTGWAFEAKAKVIGTITGRVGK